MAALVPDGIACCVLQYQKNVKYQAKRVIFHPGQVPLSNALFIDGEALFNSLANHAKLESAVSIFSIVTIGPRL